VLSVYKPTDSDRSLMVEQAAEKGLAIEQFRQLEDRIQRDDTTMRQVREQLQPAAKGSDCLSAVKGKAYQFLESPADRKFPVRAAPRVTS
jgi:hypothetical protein